MPDYWSLGQVGTTDRATAVVVSAGRTLQLPAPLRGRSLMDLLAKWDDVEPSLRGLQLEDLEPG